MSLTATIRDRIAAARYRETRELGEWVIAQLSARARKASEAATANPASMRRGGKTKAERSAYMRALAAKSHEARRLKITAAQETSR